ncbi:TPA: hypothetical protein ACQ444_003565 [Bacillus cereus]|uniref:hypothetical protein n=1 Tax=Bacillus sp. SM-B1 TaxID=2980102 RepID=UPI0029496CE1|nr:hypothetical protein [Bacillus sp. SM-B1]MDV6038130.1 hypothetical protein [Bacillus sp. SM-B1]
MKIISELELKKMIELEKDSLVVRKDISDEKLKRFLSYYEFFTNNVIGLVEKEGKNTILYSKYYWYTKYKKRYFEVYGYDAGIEQEGFKLLEELENELEDGIDWLIIQDIEESEK